MSKAGTGDGNRWQRDDEKRHAENEQNNHYLVIIFELLIILLRILYTYTRLHNYLFKNNI